MATQPEPLRSAEVIAAVEHCPNCQAELVGNYCHNCGQKKVHQHDLTVRHFLHDLTHEITHLDSNKILKTLVALLFQPGRLTAEYLAGRRGQYISPIRVYLTISFLYFLFGWGAIIQLGGGSTANLSVQPWFRRMAQQRGMEVTTLAEKVDQKREKYASALRFSSVLLSGLVLLGLYAGQKRLYVEHLIFSLHFYSFDFLLRCLMALVVVGGLAAGVNWFTPFRIIFYPVLFAYLLLALRRVYQTSWLKTVGKSVAMFIFEVLLFVGVVILSTIIAFSFI